MSHVTVSVTHFGRACESLYFYRCLKVKLFVFLFKELKAVSRCWTRGQFEAHGKTQVNLDGGFANELTPRLQLHDVRENQIHTYLMWSLNSFTFSTFLEYLITF